MSLVALEAGACGKAVPMTDRCGFDDAVACGATAVPPGPPFSPGVGDDDGERTSAAMGAAPPRQVRRNTPGGGGRATSDF
jgi:hypothetical protein